MLDDKDDAIDNELIEEADNVQIGVMVVDSVGSKDVESALVMLKKKLKQKLDDVTPFSLKAMNTSKGKKILACTKISSNSSKFVLPLCLDV